MKLDSNIKYELEYFPNNIMPISSQWGLRMFQMAHVAKAVKRDLTLFLVKSQAQVQYIAVRILFYGI